MLFVTVYEQSEFYLIDGVQTSFTLDTSVTGRRDGGDSEQDRTGLD